MILEPNQPEYFLDSFPRDDFPRYQWTEHPPTLPADAWTTETTHLFPSTKTRMFYSLGKLALIV